MYGFVLKEKVNGTTSRSYNEHKKASESSSKIFKGVKGGYNNGLTDGGHVALIWLQFPRRLAEEMSPEKSISRVVVIGVEGPTAVSISS